MNGAARSSIGIPLWCTRYRLVKAVRRARPMYVLCMAPEVIICVFMSEWIVEGWELLAELHYSPTTEFVMIEKRLLCKIT